MAVKNIRVAVIGGGNMGRNHVRNYDRLPQAELLALADPNPETKKLASEHGIEHFTSYEVMFDQLELDAVSIVVPTPLHYQIGKEALRRGIHCLIEKPIASTTNQAKKLVEVSKQTGAILTVGHIERFNPLVKKLKQIIDEKRLGDITSVVSKRVGAFPVVEPRTDVIIDLAVHDIDIISYLLGRHPQRVFSHGSQTLHTHKIDSAELLMDFGDASGFVQANWVTPVKIRTIAVTGSEGYIEGNYITQELTHYEHNVKPKTGAFREFVKTAGKPRRKSIKVAFKEPLADELKAFLKAVQTKDTTGLTNAHDAKEALRIALSAIRQHNGRSR